MMWCKKYIRLLTLVKMKLFCENFPALLPKKCCELKFIVSRVKNSPKKLQQLIKNIWINVTIFLIFIQSLVHIIFYNLDFRIRQKKVIDDENTIIKIINKSEKSSTTSTASGSSVSNSSNRKLNKTINSLSQQQQQHEQQPFFDFKTHNNNIRKLPNLFQVFIQEWLEERKFRQKRRIIAKHLSWCHGFKNTLQVNLHVMLIIILWISPSISSLDINHSPNVVKTKYGLLKGVILRHEPLIEGYLGIPYATPPLGSLRFMPPITPSSWKNIRYADNYPPVCPQNIPSLDIGMDALFKMPRYRFTQLRNIKSSLSNYSEDCLYLNMFVPRITSTTTPLTPQQDKSEKSSSSSSQQQQAQLATLVYIHGESYEWSSGNLYDGTILAAHSKVIVVTLNYRLGVLGFLKTGNKDSTQGNFGLMDLVAALHWLRENLPAFNGNPQLITLMGHGHGAALANILTISPVSNDLVRRAILISGSALSPWAIQHDPLSIKKKVAFDTGCHGDVLDDDIAPCLRKKPLSDLLAIKLDPPRFLPGFAPFTDGFVVPSVIDKNVVANLTESGFGIPPGGIITDLTGIEMANFAKKELLFAVTSIESYLDFNAQDLEFGFNETKKDRILRTFVRNIFNYHLNEIFSALKNEYTDWERTFRNQLGSRDTTLEFLSDGHTLAPLVKIGYLHNMLGGKSYFMHFKYKTEERDYPQRYGSVKGEDVPFYFGLPISPLFSNKITNEDIKSSEILMFYLGNFIKTGNPNGNDLSESHPILNLATINQLRELKKRVLRRPFTSSLQQNFQLENYYNTNNNNNNNNNNDNKSTQQQQQHSYLDLKNNNNNNNSKKYYKTSSIQQLKSSATSSMSARQRRSFRSWSTSSSHRISRKSLRNSYSELDDDDEDELNSESSENFNQRTDKKEKSNSSSNKTSDSFQKLLLPYWKDYETINQNYLEFSDMPKMKHHYRGHKLSMWLSLIPQIQTPEYNADISMRHHIFEKDDSNFYDGKIRQQGSIQKSSIIRVFKTTTPVPVIKSMEKTMKYYSTSPITECPLNSTKSTLIIEANQQINATTLKSNLFREIISSQYQNYSMAFLLTILVGCCLLMLNAFIFCAIYYQRGKGKKYATRKKIISNSIEDSSDRDNATTTSNCHDRMARGFHHQKTMSTNVHRVGNNEELRDKQQHLQHHFEISGCNNKIHQSNSNTLKRQQQRPLSSCEISNHSNGSNSREALNFRSPHHHNCDIVSLNNAADMNLEIPEPPPPPRLRTPKKRVQIQEISV